MRVLDMQCSRALSLVCEVALRGECVPWLKLPKNVCQFKDDFYLIMHLNDLINKYCKQLYFSLKFM